MKNIINWTLGGFFRSIGRILSFIVIGGLIAFLISKSGLKMPQWLQPLYVVHAAVLEPWATSENRIRWDQQGTDTYSSWNSTPYTYTPSYPVDKIQFRLKATNGLSYENTYILQFGYKPTPQSITPIKVNIFTNINSVVYQEIVCTEFQYNSNNYNLVKCSFTPNEDISSITWLYVEINLTSGYVTEIRPYMYGFEERKGTNAVITDTGNQIIINIEDQTEQIENAIQDSTNDLKDAISNSNLTCTTTNINRGLTGNQEGIKLTNSGTITNNSSSITTKYIEIGKNTVLKGTSNLQSSQYTCFYDENYTNISCFYPNTANATYNVPNNAKYMRSSMSKSNASYRDFLILKTCINGNQAINDILTDVDSSNDSSVLSDFFHNLGLNTEQPLSSIITLPINMLRTLLVDYNASESHADLCTTFAGQTICLPSGDLLWKRSGCHDNSPFGCPQYATFKTFFQLVVGGFIYWTMLKRLVKTAEKGLDPQQSGVNLMKL